MVEAGLIDQLDLRIPNFIIGARPVFDCGGRGSVGTANGVFSMVVNGACSLKESGCVGKRTRLKPCKKASNAMLFGHASVATLTFLSVSQRFLQRNVRVKATLESYSC